MTDAPGKKDPSDELYAANVLDHLETGVATVDRHSHIRTINRSARSLLGVQSTAIGDDLLDQVPAILTDPLRSVLDAARHGVTSTAICQGSYRTASHEWRDLQISAHPVAEAERPPEVTVLEVVVIQDGADRFVRRLQDQFLAVAGHELRTPLTVLSLALDLAARRSERLHDTHLRLHLDRAIVQAHRLNDLAAKLVDSAQLESMSPQLQRRPTNLADLTRRQVETAQAIAGPQVIHFDGPADTVMVLADARRIEQALRNVLANALTFSGGKGPIGVRLTTLGDRAEIDIHNHGPTIPSEAATRIFERFYRIGDERSSQEGLGLGLFVAREIVQAHGGTIEAKPGVRDGAAFALRLPLLEPRTPGNHDHRAVGSE